MQAIHADIMTKLAKMTSEGMLKWQRRESDRIHWIKTDKIKMVLSMRQDKDFLLIETSHGPMVMKGGTVALKNEINKLEWEMK
jgi:hypothetical protein